MNILSSYYQPADTTTTLSTKNIEFTLETGKKQFKQGENVDITLSVKNIKKESLSLNFETTEQCEFIIRHEENFVLFSHKLDVWKSSYNKQYEDKENSIVLKPGEKKVFKCSWKQVNSRGEAVEPGKYSISAILLTKEKQPLLELKMNTK